MSQSDELRQAAALLEFWFNMEADNETARDEEDRDPEYTKVIKAALTVSKFMRKHLAEHPADDDEPIDEAWFDALTTPEWESRQAIRTEAGVVWRSESIIYLNERRLGHIKTRGQLRRLLAALGAGR